jgi:primosomal protein N' (replication factor Y)
LQQLIQSGYAAFAKTAMNERIAAHYPPATFNALFQAEATYLGHAKTFLQETKQILQQYNQNGIELLGPVPAVYTKKAGKFRYQLYCESTSRLNLHQLLKISLKEIEALKSTSRVKWRMEVDPIGD